MSCRRSHRQSHRDHRSHQIVLSLLTVALAVACTVANESGSSGTLSEPFLDVTATWTGTWASSLPAGESGTIEIVFVQDLESTTSEGVSKVEAVTTIMGSSCFTTGDGLSSVGFVQLTGDLIVIPLMVDLGPPIVLIPKQQFAVVLDILADDMVGTYSVPSHIIGIGCIDDFGTITATRN